MPSRGRARTLADTGKTPARKLLVLQVNGQPLTVDAKAMTIRERQLARAELAKLPNADHMDFTMASIWIALRRDDKTLTFEEACEAFTVEQLENAEYVDPEGDTPEA